MIKKNIDWEDEFDFGEKKSDNKDLLRFIGRILSNWYWFLLCGMIGCMGAFIYLRYTIPNYRIHAKLLVADDKKGGIMGASALADLSGLMGAKNSVDNEVEVIKTADLMREMVLAEKAYINAFKVGTVHKVPTANSRYILDLLSSTDSIATAISFQIVAEEKEQLVLSGPDTTFRIRLNQGFLWPNVGLLRLTHNPQYKSGSKDRFGFSVMPVRNTVESLMKTFSAEVTNKLVSTIDLTFTSTLPQQGEEQLTALIDKYIELSLYDKNVIADSTLAFINARLTKITEELAGVEDQISSYKKQTQLADISEQSKVLVTNSADYAKSLAASETQLAALDVISTYLQDIRHPRVVPSAVISQDMAFNGLIGKYNELVLQRERLLLANTEDNPLVQNINGQIANVRQDMIANVETTRKQLVLAKQSQQKLSNQVNSQIALVPTIERGYIDLARLQQIKQAQYIFLQEKWEETAIGRTANVAIAKIIDSPKAEDEPFNPKKRMVYIAGLLIGLLVPSGIMWVRNILNIKIQDIGDIERLSELPILGTVSHSDEDQQVVVSCTSRSAIAEQFRAMRTNLEFALKGGKRILLTSSRSGEGKTYVALNLAVSLALLDKKVLLMELDLRKPSITSKLGLPTGVGFSHYIVRQDMQIEDIIMSSDIHENVDLIQAGAIPPNPAELLVHSRSSKLMAELALRYDYILIDSPPVGMVTDAQLLSRYTDLCLYLVRQNHTYKEQIRIPNDLVKHDKIKSIQLIVNDIPVKGGYYGYGYGYYGKDDKQNNWKRIWKKK